MQKNFELTLHVHVYTCSPVSITYMLHYNWCATPVGAVVSCFICQQFLKEKGSEHKKVTSHTISFWSWVAMVNAAGRAFYNELYDSTVYPGCVFKGRTIYSLALCLPPQPPFLIFCFLFLSFLHFFASLCTSPLLSKFSFSPCKFLY